MSRSASLVVLVTVAGCSLLVDVEGVRAARDAGGFDASMMMMPTDSGQTDAGEPDAGTDAGAPDAGMVDAGPVDAGQEPYDGGARCSASLRPRLRCDAPVVLVDGGSGLGHALLSSVAGGVVAGWASASAVELHLVGDDGGRRQLVSEAALGVARTMLSSEGAAWAFIYHTGVNSPVRCFSSFDDGGVTSAMSSVNGAAVAVAETGGVALALGGSNMRAELTGAGCPTSVRTFAFSPDSEWVGAVHLPGQGVPGFRITSSGTFNFCNSAVAIYAPQPDGGLDFSATIVNSECIEDHTASVSSSGLDVMMAYSASDSSDVYSTRVRALGADLSPLVTSSSRVFGFASWWMGGACGPGCHATVMAPGDAPSHVVVAFNGDDANALPLTASHAGWDAVCATRLGDTSVATAWHQGRLALLVVEPNQVRLLRCDVPPLE